MANVPIPSRAVHVFPYTIAVQPISLPPHARQDKMGLDSSIRMLWVFVAPKSRAS